MDLSELVFQIEHIQLRFFGAFLPLPHKLVDLLCRKCGTGVMDQKRQQLRLGIVQSETAFIKSFSVKWRAGTP